MNELTCVLRGINDTKRLAARLAGLLQAGDVLILSGDLGAGKTTLTQEILACWGIAQVLSPTFTLMHSYQAEFPVHHLDLYRLERVEEVLNLGWDELFDGMALVIVEWLDKFPELYPEEYFCVTLRYGEDSMYNRIAVMRGRGVRGMFLLEEVRASC